MLFEGVPITTCARKRTYNFQQPQVTKKAVCGLLIMHIYVIDIIKQCYSDICALKFSNMNSTEFSAIFLCLFAVVVQISGYDRKCTKWEIAFGCNPKVCIRSFFSFFAYPNT